MSRYGLESVDAPTFEASKRKSVTIRKKSLLMGLLLVVSYAYTMTGGTGAGTTPADSAARIVQQIIVRADGQDMIAVRGVSLFRLNKFWQNAGWPQTPITSLAAGANQTARESNFFIPFIMPWSYVPEVSALPTYAVDSPSLIVDWGAASDLMVGEDGVPAVSSVGVEVYERPIEGVPLDPRVYGALRISFNQYVITATETNKKLYIDSHNEGQELRAVLVEADVNGIDNDSLITKLRLNVNGEDKVNKSSWNVIRGANVQAFGLAQREAGAVLLDSAEDKRTGRGELWTLNAMRPFVEVDVALQGGGTNTITITTVALDRASRA